MNNKFIPIDKPKSDKNHPLIIAAEFLLSVKEITKTKRCPDTKALLGMISRTTLEQTASTAITIIQAIIDMADKELKSQTQDASVRAHIKQEVDTFLANYKEIEQLGIIGSIQNKCKTQEADKVDYVDLMRDNDG